MFKGVKTESKLWICVEKSQLSSVDCQSRNKWYAAYDSSLDKIIQNCLM